FNLFREGMEAYRPGFLGNAEKIRGVGNMVRELFGVDTGDATAKTAAAGWTKATEAGEDMARRQGKGFDSSETWRLPQPWDTRQVGKFTEQQFVDAWRAELDAGGVKLWDKDTNKPATGARIDFVLRRAYSDIKSGGGSATPFSKEKRTFQFQPGSAGA